MDLEGVLPFVFIGIFIGVFVAVILAAKAQQRRARDNLARLAERLRLQLSVPARSGIFSSTETSLAGSFRGRQIRVFSYHTGSGKNRTRWCAVASRIDNPAGLTLRISKENALTRAGRKIGIDDVAVGDESFDRECYVKSNQPDFIRAALLPEIRLRLTNLWQSRARGSFSIDAAEVRYAEIGAFSNGKICDRIPAIAEVVCDLGEIAEAFPG